VSGEAVRPGGIVEYAAAAHLALAAYERLEGALCQLLLLELAL